jgi:hypothetical protein
VTGDRKGEDATLIAELIKALEKVYAWLREPSNTASRLDNISEYIAMVIRKARGE